VSGFREILLIGSLGAAVCGAIALVIALRTARATDGAAAIRPGLRVIASDTGAAPSMLVTDPALGLRGRPDYLLEEIVGHSRVVVPLEVKPTHQSERLYESDEIQLAAYLIASRATFGSNAADFGYVQYASKSFRVRLTDRMERRVRDIISGIRDGRQQQRLHRSHGIPARCRRCAMRARCDEAL
jgi:hypothetical protein